MNHNAAILAAFMETHPELPFDMALSNNPQCGTAGCIGGFAAALWPEVQADSGTRFDRGKVSEKLGLSEQAGDTLLYPGEGTYINPRPQFDDLTLMQINYDDITRKGAIATLRRLALTGEVTWLYGEQ
jgi:hypothetical protein